MLRVTSAALVRPIVSHKAQLGTASVNPIPRQVSRVLLAATTLSVLGSSRIMSAAAAAPAGECTNPQGPVPENIQNLSSDLLKV